MTDKDKDYLRDLFMRINTGWALRKEVSAFENFFSHPSWILLPYTEKSKVRLDKPYVEAYIKEKIHSGINQSAIDSIYTSIKKAAESKELQSIKYDKCNGLCYPLEESGKLFGFIVLCGVKRKISDNLQSIFKSFTDTIIREAYIESELEELNKTIRPRAVALSTVHTLHRLISSTLDLGELLPRIARLSLQVLRANRCSIKLVDKKRKVLLPKTTIDLRKEKTKLKKVQMGKYAPGRAAKQGRIIRGEKYLAAPLIDEEILGVITLYDKIDGTSFSNYDEEIMKTLTEQAVIAIRNAQLYEQQENLTMASIKCIATILESRPHSSRLPEASFIRLLKIIGNKFNMNDTEIKMMQYAAMLQDAGKITIPEKVLMKKGGLTGKEYDLIKRQSKKGADILSKIKPLKPIGPIILHHHENYDGTGYPTGLKGEEIPLGSRILSVVSSFEAMIIDRPYRKSISIDSAINEIKKNSGTQFDPLVVQVFADAVSQKSVLKLLHKEISMIS